MSFPEWAEAIVAAVRRYLPDARAVRKGARVVQPSSRLRGFSHFSKRSLPRGNCAHIF
jgi:hypothetical protein